MKKNIEQIYALSPLQRGMLQHSLAAAGTGTYVVQISCRLRGELDGDLFAAAWQKGLSRHAIFRTSFHWEEVQKPVQIVHREVAFDLRQIDLRDRGPESRAQALEAVAVDERVRTFDLMRPPLTRLMLVRLDDDSHQFIWTTHHLLIDGWSLPIVLQDVLALYAVPSLELEPAADYQAYIRWLRGQDGAAAQTHYEEALGDFAGMPRFPILVDGDAQPSSSATAEHLLSVELGDRLRDLARQQQTTLAVIFQAAWAMLLRRYTRTADVCFGLVVAGRPADLEHAEKTVGPFINTVPVRTTINSNDSVADLIAQLQKQQKHVQSHAHAPLADVQRWAGLTGSDSLFDTLIAFENYPFDDGLRKSSFAGLTIENADVEERTHYPVTLVVSPEAQLRLRILFDPKALGAGAAARLAGHLEAVLAQMADDVRAKLSSVSVRGARGSDRSSETSAVATDLDDSQPTGSLLHRRFAAQASQTPEATALIFGQQRLTYGELEVRANRLAHRMIAEGLRPGDRIALWLDRSADLIVCMLAALKAGASYLPIDISTPADRVAIIVDDAEARLTVTDTGRAAQLEGSATAIEALQVGLGDLPATAPEVPRGPEDSAYMIYTSGSTGRPKGAVVSHHNVARLFDVTRAQFGFGGRSVFAQFHSPSFDVSVWEIYGALLHGGTLVIVSQETARSPRLLSELLEQHGVTVLCQTPSAFRPLMRNLLGRPQPSPLALEWIIFAGEALDFATLRPWVERFGDQRPGLVNMYGPTEATVYVTERRILIGDLGGGHSYIGRALDDLVLHVVDEDGNALPDGVAGELWISGPAVCQGYWNRPELTAECFGDDPFQKGYRVYRTGDLVRRDPGGDLAYLGRLDDQVKIRGYRIEPGEIQVAILASARVRDAAVLAETAAGGEHLRLVAYVVPSGADPAVDMAALRAELAESLPPYMVPGEFHCVAELPLTKNGKLDRRALRDARKAAIAALADDGFEEEITTTQGVVKGVFAEILNATPASIDSDFFSLGGDSLLATQVVSRLRAELGIDMPLRVVFERPTARLIAQEVDERIRTRNAATDYPLAPVERVGIDGGVTLPLSFAQERLWFMTQLVPDSPFYNIPIAARITGMVDMERLEQALGAVIDRHEVLRTAFVAKNGRPVQQVLAEVPTTLVRHDLRGLSAAERERRAEAIAERESRTTFDLERPPLFRAALTTIRDDEHILSLTIHHIVADGWSIGVLLHDFGRFYRALLEGQPLVQALERPALQYADFAVAQRNWLESGGMETQLEHWRNTLEGVSSLAIPGDRQRPAVQTYRGATLEIKISSSSVAALRDLGRSEGATLYMTMLSVFATLLARYSGQDDLVIGSPIANRNRVELEPLIGFFVNTLALRIDATGEPTFRDLLHRVRDTTLAAYANQDLPFERLVEELSPDRSLSQTPIFQVAFVHQNAPLPEMAIPGVHMRPLLVDSGTAKFDLALFFSEGGGTPSMWFEYSTELFDAATIERLARNLDKVFDEVCRVPSARIWDLDIIDDDERNAIADALGGQGLQGANERVDGGAAELALARFYRIAEDQPEAVAVEGGEGDALSYRELAARSRQLALAMRQVGVRPGDRVGVMLPRTTDLVATLLGCWSAGAAYVPLDPALPVKRLSAMVDDSAIAALITSPELAARLLDGRAADGSAADGSELGKVPFAIIDPAEVTAPTAGGAAVGIAADGGSPAYVIYTSGSTGVPKGVEITHGNVASFLDAMTEAFDLDATMRMLGVTTVSFDISVLEIFCPLTVGGSVVLASDEVTADGRALRGLFEACGANYLQATPSTFRMLLEAGFEGAEDLTLICGGEAWETSLAIALADRCERLFNAYGPTEATVWATLARIERNATSVPMGRPIAGTRVLLLDRFGHSVPIGVPGELYIAGPAVARGYLNRPELTKERFVALDAEGATLRAYRTGDNVRLRADGQLEFLGRGDGQIKLRGFRIELGDIEAALDRHAGVSEAVVVVRDRAALGIAQTGSGLEPGDASSAETASAGHDGGDDPGNRAGATTAADAGRDADRVADWRVVWNDAYADAHEAHDPTFALSGWISSFDGMPIPSDEMRDWLDQTVAGIEALRPSRVLEIGCGSGMILHRIAPQVERYVATDLSSRALAHIESQTRHLPQVECRESSAESIGELAGGFDTVILNSVAQYFPSADYLLDVLTAAVGKTVDGGSIFLGDLRNAALLEALHAAILARNSASATSPSKLGREVADTVRHEEELSIAPAFFESIGRVLPRVRGVTLSLKTGRARNELMGFRYDAVLHVGPSSMGATEIGGLSARELWWGKDVESAEALAELVRGETSGGFVVRGIPDGRLVESRHVLGFLAGETIHERLGQLRRERPARAIEPADVLTLAESAGRRALIIPTDDPRGAFDAVIAQQGRSQASSVVATRDGCSDCDTEPGSPSAIAIGQAAVDGDATWRSMLKHIHEPIVRGRANRAFDGEQLVAYVAPDTARAGAVRAMCALEAVGTLDGMARTELANGVAILHDSAEVAALAYGRSFAIDWSVYHGLGLSPNATVVDVGAGLGLFSLMALGTRDDVRVIALEAAEQLAPLLGANLAIHGGNRATVVEADRPPALAELAPEAPTIELLRIGPTVDAASMLASPGIERVQQIIVECATDDPSFDTKRAAIDEAIRAAGMSVTTFDVPGCRFSIGMRSASASPARTALGAKVAYAGADLWRSPGKLLADLWEHLAAELPDYMRPNVIRLLDTLPKTANGKVDRKALPNPFSGRADLDVHYAPPRTATEVALVAILTEVLGVDAVGIHDDFFELGGHSLMVARVVARAEETLGISLPLRALFEAPTVAALAATIDAADGNVAPTAASPDVVNEDAKLDPLLQPASPIVACAENAQHIFLTGVTGFLGTYLLDELLKRTTATIHCLVRAPDENAAMDRIRTFQETYGLWNPGHTDRIVPVLGDLAKPMLGLSTVRFGELAELADVILHNGAMVHLLTDYETLRPANVDGTREVIRMAMTGRTTPIHYVSTIGVFDCEGHHTDSVYEEDAPLDSFAGIHTPYNQTKWVAECLVAEAGRRGIPVTIHRPAQIVGYAESGTLDKYSFMTHAIIGCVQLGSYPDIDLMVNMAPVRFVAEAIVYAVGRRDVAGRVFHQDHPDPPRLREFADTLGQLGYPVQALPGKRWIEAIEAAGPGNFITPFLPLVKKRTDLDTRTYPRVSVRNMMELLEGSDVVCPALDAGTVGPLIERYASGALAATKVDEWAA